MYASKLAFNGCCFVDVLNRVDAKVKRCLLLDELVFWNSFLVFEGNPDHRIGFWQNWICVQDHPFVDLHSEAYLVQNPLTCE